MKTIVKNHSTKSGFTIVELIVVIVVIAILATITLVSYNVIRDKARATALVSEITKVEEAYHLMAADQFTGTWWRDNIYGVSGNPSFEAIINSTDPDALLFKKFISEVPKVSGMNLSWVYDNDGDAMTEAVKSTCPRPTTANWISVVLVISPVDTAIARLVDEKMDDGDLRCGRIMSNGSGIQYQLSYNQKI